MKQLINFNEPIKTIEGFWSLLGSVLVYLLGAIIILIILSIIFY